MLLLAVDHLQAVNDSALGNAPGPVARLLPVRARVGHRGQHYLGALVALHAGLSLLCDFAQTVLLEARVAGHRAVEVVKQQVQILFLLRRHRGWRGPVRNLYFDRALLRRFPLLVGRRVGVQLRGGLRLQLLLQRARDVVRSYRLRQRVGVTDHNSLRQDVGQLGLVVCVPRGVPFLMRDC